MSAADMTATFDQHLQASGLLSEAQLRELRRWVAAKKPDVQAMAKEINRRGWLTAYQIREIARGRGSSLRVAERYVLLDVLGEGGMGRVYKAHDTRMGRDIAFKVIRKEKLSQSNTAGRFVQEMIALGAMAKHPNVVEVFTADQMGDTHYCVMEYIDGTDLTKLVRDRGVMPVPQACDAIRQAALGLQHAFETGLVHRDIKPSNIIVPRAGGSVKLVDLGLARLMDPPGGEDAHRVTQEGFVIGTPDFLAPEQARDPMSVDIRADIYALGGTLFYILTGRVPYDGGTPTEKLLRHHTDPPPSLLKYRPDAPPQVEQIVHWCMAKKPEDRPQTPMQLAIALQPFCPALAPSGALAAAGTARYPVPPGGQQPAPPGYAPRPAYPAYAPPTPPAPAQPEPFPLPPLDPNSNSQVFKLPPDSAQANPIRRRARKQFPTGPLLVGVGALVAVAALAFVAFRYFRGTESPTEPSPKSATAEPPKAVPDPFTNTAGMKLVKLDGGPFRMGSPDNEPGRNPDGREGQARAKTVPGPLFMSATEVTNAQYRTVMGAPPTGPKGPSRDDNLPVVLVTWPEAAEFCTKLTEKEKGQPWARPGWEYRLPTEAEWEYACRAGTETPTAFGGHLTFGKHAVFRANGEDPIEAPGSDKTDKPVVHEVGKTDPNRFGLHDMHGNVAEWCRDLFRPDAKEGAPRTIRGGSFRDPASAARSAARERLAPLDRRDWVGFRVVYAPLTK